VAASLKPRQEVKSRHLLDAFPTADPQQTEALVRSLEHVRRHRQAHALPRLRYELEHPDGRWEERHWQVTHYPVVDAEGQLRYILQRTQDVTEQVQAEREAALARQALAAEQERTRFVLENLPVLIWTNDAHGRPDYYNARWQAYTGVDSRAGVDWEQHQLVHPDDEARVQQEIASQVAQGQEYQVEFRLRRHDGQYRWLLCRNVPRRDAQGRVSMWVGGGVDVHEQKELVRELLATSEQQAALVQQAYQAHERSQQERESFQALFNQAPAMISLVRGPQYVFEFVNPAYQQLKPGEQLLGRTVAEVFPEAIEQGFGALLDQVYRTGEPFEGKALRLQYDRFNNGQLIDTYFDFTYQALREQGHIVGISCFAVDVTNYVAPTAPLPHG
jgi:PAS domain S-box-containing protein